MPNEFEEIENIANKLKEKYPDAKTFLDAMVQFAEWSLIDVYRCQYDRLLDDYGLFKANAILAMGEGHIHSDDFFDFLDIDNKFRSHIRKTLLEKCNCDLPQLFSPIVKIVHK